MSLRCEETTAGTTKVIFCGGKEKPGGISEFVLGWLSPWALASNPTGIVLHEVGVAASADSTCQRSAG